MNSWLLPASLWPAPPPSNFEFIQSHIGFQMGFCFLIGSCILVLHKLKCIKDYSLGMNLVTTVIGFGMSTTFIVFVCTRLICGRIRASESRPTFDIDSTTDLEQQDHRISGLEPVVVASIPTMKFDRDNFKSSEDAQCTICLGDYQEKEILRIMPKCKHNFHLVCIDVWLRKQSTCPVCRLPLHELFETRQVRTPMLGMVIQSIDESQIVDERSHDFLLPGHEYLGFSPSNQPQIESINANSGSDHPIEAETRR